MEEEDGHNGKKVRRYLLSMVKVHLDCKPDFAVIVEKNRKKAGLAIIRKES